MLKKHILLTMPLFVAVLFSFWYQNLRPLPVEHSSPAPASDPGRVLGTSESKSDVGLIAPNVPVLVKPERIEKNDPVLGDGSYVVLEARSGEVLFQKNAERKVSLASLTKIATALTALVLRDDPDAYYQVKAEDLSDCESTSLRVGDELRLIDLIALALVSSDNGAAQALAPACGLSEADFLGKMEETTARLGLSDMDFADLAGLHAANKATALDVSRLMLAAAENPVLAEVLSRREALVKTKSGREIRALTTDWLLGRPRGPRFGKTGFTNTAGACFSGLWEDDDRRYIVSVLGSADKKSRFTEAQVLADWTRDAFSWTHAE